MTTLAPPAVTTHDHGAPARVAPVIEDATYLASLKKVTQYYVVVAFLALFVGALLGPLQALNYADVNLYDLPIIRNVLQSYYHGLTLHGVLNALVFTQFFISGWMLYLPVRDMGARISMPFAWFTFWMMTVGLLIAAVPLLLNEASVLYTLYPPMQGHPAFYIGAAIMVAATWLVLGQVIHTYWRWKRANPGTVTPLVTYMSVATWMMWFLASLGLVSSVLLMLIPWSLGLIAGVDVLLARTLFWWTGHAIVYFWVLPAYISWYAFLPRAAGGRTVSEPLARLAFTLFLLNSVPVGLHHQYSDTNISAVWMTIHMFLTFMIAVPSLLTAFSVAASLEDGARQKGFSGPVGWMRGLPWGNPVFSAQVLALISFIFGGAGGIVNASSTFAGVVHNTAWIPGHFHITVGTATTLSFMGIALWLIPHLTGKRLPSVKLANFAVYTWFVGMMVFALGMHWQGLYGVPRRSQISDTAQNLYREMPLQLPMLLTGLSGVILLVSVLAFFYVLFKMLLSRRVDDGEATPIPYSPTISSAGTRLSSAPLLVRVTEPLFVLWGIGLVLVLMMYGSVVLGMLINLNLVPGQVLY